MKKLTKVIYLLSLFINLTVIAAEPTKQDQIQLPNIIPNREQAIASLNTAELLQNYHYHKLPLDKERSAIIFDNYLNALDYNRTLFTAEDVYQMSSWRSEISEFIKIGDLNPAFRIYRFYMIRQQQYLKHVQNKLAKGIENLDFSGNDRLQLKRDELPYAANQEELINLWDMLFKDEVLRLKIAKKSNAEITTLLTKRYANQQKILSQTKSSDAFNVYMNSITTAYDPHTEYMPPASMENFNIHMSLSLSGIGAQLTNDNGYTKITNLINGGPALKSGQLKASDRIIGVAQEDQELVDVVGWRLDDVVSLIRGEKGTKLTLEVIPASNVIGDETSKKVTLIRDEIKLEDQAASSQIIEQNSHKIGIIKIPSFYIDFDAYHAEASDYKSTTRDVKNILRTFKSQNVGAVVIDLRNNGGGSLQEANDLISLFIGANPTVLVRSSNNKVDTLIADSKDGAFYEGPLTVLINRYSASASEIFAAAMQDYHRALIVGSQSFGKGTVQSIQNITNGKLKLTTAKFYRVSGQSTQHKGVIPDIEFPEIVDITQTGESSLPQAIGWDSITPAVTVKRNLLAQYLTSLNDLHNLRTKNNPEFDYVRKNKALNLKLAKDTSVSLNEEQRLKEYASIEKQRINLENIKRKARNLQPLHNLQELEQELEQEIISASNNPSNFDVTKDAYLAESVNIAADYLTLSHNLAAN